jgi:hypothetical protein
VLLGPLQRHDLSWRCPISPYSDWGKLLLQFRDLHAVLQLLATACNWQQHACACFSTGGKASCTPTSQIPGLVILGHCRVGMPDAAVVAKLEDVPGLAGFADILPVTDAVIFSRGSLGTALAPEKVGDRLAAL